MAEMLSYEDALERLVDEVPLLSREDVGLRKAVGRVLGEQVVPDRAQPPHAVSAMDGYAIRFGDGRSDFDVVGEVAAGARFEGTLGPGEAVRIFTGALLPSGADTVIVQEDAQRLGDVVSFSAPPKSGAHVRAAGIDFPAGEPVLRAGRMLAPMDVALAAAANRSRLNVYRQPVVHVFATGDELVEPGRPLSDTAIVNSGAYGISALAEQFGGLANARPILPDDEEQIRAAIDHARQGCDIIVTIGGASVGDYDLVKPAMASLGAEMIFEKVAVRPGKPTWHARFGEGPLVLGLPGNPASASVCAWLFLKPLIRAMMGAWTGEHDWHSAALARDVGPNGDRSSFLRGFCWSEDGCLRTAPSSHQDSSLLTPLAEGNALIYRAPGADAAAADTRVQILPLGPVANAPPPSVRS